VLVEQFFDFAFELGDRFVVLERGEITLDKPQGQVERNVLHAAVSV
jgi:urea transport system ATP-binding protein